MGDRINSLVAKKLRDEEIAKRTISVEYIANSLDIERTNGDYILATPFDDAGGNVTIYPPSPQLEINQPPIELRGFEGVVDLYLPHDAKYDFVRRKIWIADTGNNRVLKVDVNTRQVDVALDNVMVYPHSIAVNLNNGGAFVKGYSTFDSYGIVYYLNSDGSTNQSFEFDVVALNSSSSTSEDVISSGFPEMPHYKSVVYDHVRGRTWWVWRHKVYMSDERNNQVKTYNLRSDRLKNAISLDIDGESGNAFIACQDGKNNSVLAQMFRDNNKLLAWGYYENVV